MKIEYLTTNMHCVQNDGNHCVYIGCEKTLTGAMGLRMRPDNRLDRACAVFYRQLSDISVAVRH